MSACQLPPENARPRYGPGERIAVLVPVAVAGAYDYRIPDGMTIGEGEFVSVPLGQRCAAGVVWGDGEGKIDAGKLKDITARLDCPPLPDVSRRFIDWLAAYTLSAPGTVLKMAISVPAALEPPKPLRAYAINPDPPPFRMTPARRRVLSVAADGLARTATELAREAATGTGVVGKLLGAGGLIEVQIPAAPAPAHPDPERPGPSLSAEQAQAAKQLAAAASAGRYSATLLEGVPGSGKTEVYFQAVAAALKRGRQVLVMLPEIALSAQWLARFFGRFGAPPVEWHSDLSPGQRRLAWRAVAEGRAKVVVGARSALHLPFPDLGLIVVDEEHDASYKQEDGVIYNARDMAVARACLGDIPVVLASATPSLETVVNAGSGRYRQLVLADRHAGAEMPEIDVIDMLADKPAPGRWLSPALERQLKETLAAGEQTMLFLNRRGYAPLTLCRTCGHRFQCPRCTSWLVEHRRAGQLQCHHCGFKIASPERCPQCEAEDSLVACGPGVERLAEEVAATFSGVRVELAASDTITSPRAAAKLVRRIEEHETDLIIGTQIIAKGYHFPLLTTVGVVDADLGLSGGDLRATERTYQLLYQVAGRAGRGTRPGRVLLQTYMAEHPVMAALTSGKRAQFLETEARARKVAQMPPFGRLVALIVSGRDEGAVDETARTLGRTAPGNEGVQVLGPAPAPLALLRGRHRRRLLMKAPKDINVQVIVRHWLGRSRWPSRVRVQVDVDPYSFL